MGLQKLWKVNSSTLITKKMKNSTIKTRKNMKRFCFMIIAFITAIVMSAQTIKVYEYDRNGNLSSTPAYTSSKKVKVVFTEKEYVNGHEYVDLNLPSGTLWATCNVGANSPEEYGDYFAWGETTGYNKGKVNFDWNTYKWMNKGQTSWEKIKKYTINDHQYSACWYSSNSPGYTFVGDNKIILESKDDAATVNWGNNWCMPTQDQFDELVNSSYTTSEWMEQNGIWGRKITSKSNGKSIFLPAVGYRYGTDVYDMETYGNYWSCQLSDGNSSNACLLRFSSHYTYYDANENGSRMCGLSVRPVCYNESRTAVTSIALKNMFLDMYVGDTDILSAVISPAYASDNTLTWKSSDTSIAIVDATGKVTAKGIGSVIITAIANSGSGVKDICVVNVKDHEYVDLGLPSGTLWAICNVGASKPEEYGNYFAWGETTPKKEYSYSTYKWCKGSNKTFSKYCTSSSYGTVDNKTELEPEDDAATANWGNNWCVPTESQIKELYNSSYTTTKWTTLNGISGRMITSKKNGNTLFLPASGYYSNTSRNNIGTNGCFCCWSRSINKYNCSSTYMLYSNSDQIAFATAASRCNGLSVRAVRVKK